MTEVPMGGIFYTARMKSTLGGDIQVATGQIKQFEKDMSQSSAMTQQEFRKMGFALSGEITKAGTLTASLGTSMLGMGAAAQAAGIDIGGMDTGLIVVGGSMMALSSGVRTATAAVKAYTAFTTSTAIPTMYAYAVAVWAAHGPLIAVAGVAIGLTAAYVYLTRETDRITKAHEELERQVKYLDLKLESVTYQTREYERALDSTSRTLQDQERDVDALTRAYEEYDRILDELSGIPEELSDIDREIKKAALDLMEAQLPEGSPQLVDIETARNALKLEDYQDRLDDLLTRKTGIQTREQELISRKLEIESQYHIDSLSGFKSYIEEMRALQDQYHADWLAADQTFRDKQAEREAAQYEADVAGYQLELSGMRKEDKFLTPEEKELWQTIPERAEALKREPKTYQREMGFWEKLPYYAMPIPFKEQIMERISTMPNPNYLGKSEIIQENTITVHVDSVEAGKQFIETYTGKQAETLADRATQKGMI